MVAGCSLKKPDYHPNDEATAPLSPRRYSQLLRGGEAGNRGIRALVVR